MWVPQKVTEARTALNVTCDKNALTRLLILTEEAVIHCWNIDKFPTLIENIGIEFGETAALPCRKDTLFSLATWWH